ncbi:MAG: protein kinase [Anaerolineales bacterium]|nr:protein kinase [Anaerolineales bacterium]
MTLDKDTLLHNRYRIVEILGQGGMGSVYRAIDENLGVEIALKENLITTDEYARQFRLEAVILANLKHPNLPRVSDHILLGDQEQYLVMDFIEGEDLRDRMERLGLLPEEEAVQIGAAICDALTYLHTRKPPILHRDIKPGNIKITLEGHIFLVDFGLAKVYHNASQATTTGARAMTPGYSPPEQYGTARTDSRTDIYSLGATLYASLSGFISEDGLARAMDNAQLTPLRKRNAKISRRLAAAIEKAMAVDPSDRFQTAEEFKIALLGAKSKPVQSPGSYTVVPPPPDSSSQKDADAKLPVERKSPRAPKVLVPPSATITEDQPFVSPRKMQKERDRKRHFALVRFILFVLLLLAASVPFFAPGILPADVRVMIPFLAPTHTAMPSITPIPLPSQTPVPTITHTATIRPPTATPAPTNTLIPEVVETALPTQVIIAQIGGGSGQIAYASSRTGIPQIYIVDLAGENAVQVTDMSNGACQPSWSPDGAKLVFISPCKDIDDIYHNASLYLINADGTGLTSIATSPGGNFDPAWSPDGKSIAFTSLRTGQMEIFSVNLDDLSSAIQITQGAQKVESRQPAWSQDGSQIVYTVRRFDVYQIWMMNADGTEPKQIVRSGTTFSDYLPAWSPNGELIIFNQRCVTRFCNPYLMSISGVERTVEQGKRLQINLALIQNVDYSPDGFFLAYEGFGELNKLDIFYMTVAGGDRVRLTTDLGQDFHPSWRPATTTP